MHAPTGGRLTGAEMPRGIPSLKGFYGLES